MKENNYYALITAYYLSRFDKKGLENLGYGSWKEAFLDIENKLDVKSTTIKNMRDDYDPLHDNNRVGWYQRELRPSRLYVLQKYENFSEQALRMVVKDILKKYKDNDYDNTSSIMNIMEDNELYDKESDIGLQRKYTTRGITGKLAENIFKEYFEQGRLTYFKGTLIDKREDGCGYDFEIQNKNGEIEYVIEVKGNKSESNGIIFTDKEWDIAQKLGEKYILIVVNDVYSDPNIDIYINPSQRFIPKSNVRKVITIDWVIDKKQLIDNL